MAESDTLINSLNNQVHTLTTNLATANAESKRRKIELRDVRAELATRTTERDSHAATIASLTTERDALKTAATAAPSEVQTKLDAALQTIRDRTHRDRFNELAGAAGCDPSALAAVWTLSGYKAEADAVDDIRITEALDKVKTDLPLAFAQPQSGQAGGAPPPKPPLASGPGGDRGSREKTALKFRATRQNMRDLEWQKRNQAALNEAHKNGTFELIEG